MNNKEFSQQFEKRTKKFAIDIIRLSVTLPKLPESEVIRYQLTKAGTSVGANYREANRSRSKADFINKIKICESESSESVYWLEIIQELNWVENDRLMSVLNEASELIAIFTSIGTKMKMK